MAGGMDMTRQFQEAMDSADMGATPPEPAGDDPTGGGDAVCPTCGASASKIQQAAGGGPPMGAPPV